MDKISIVTSLYRSSKYVRDFYHEHLNCIKQLNVDYEFIFVDDGYPDDAAKLVEQLIEIDKKVKLILLSRNFGQYPAMFAGLANTTGNLVYATDSDLEEDPKNIILLYNKIKGDATIDVVYGVLDQRKGGVIRGSFGKLFYLILDNLSDIKVPHDQAWQRIMKKKYVDSLLKYNEVETLPAGLMILAGFNQQPLMMEKTYKGSTSYTFGKRLKLALNSITAFSSKPLVYIGLLGISITILAFMLLSFALIRELFFVNYQSGWISTIGSIWMVGGLILSSVGVVGIYLAKIFNQVKNRPLYIIKTIIDQEQPK